MLTYHEPQMKYWRNMNAASWILRSVCPGRIGPGSYARVAMPGAGSGGVSDMGMRLLPAPSMFARGRMAAESLVRRRTSDAVQLLHPHDVDLSIRHRGRGVVGVAQVVDGQHRQLRPGLHDDAAAAAGEEEVAVGVGDG